MRRCGKLGLTETNTSDSLQKQFTTVVSKHRLFTMDFCYYKDLIKPKDAKCYKVKVKENSHTI